MSNEPNNGAPSVSIFAAVSFIIYIYSSVSNIDPLITSTTLEYNPHNISPLDIMSSENLPGINIFIIVFHLSIAIRLYSHAWAIDELRNITSTLKSPFLSFFEWVLRSGWVLMTIYLPNLYPSNPFNFLDLDILTGLYYTAIFSLLVLWDSVMFGHISGNTFSLNYLDNGLSDPEQRRYILKLKWLWIDWALLFLSGLLVVSTSGIIGNWQVIFFPVVCSFIILLCMFQVFQWLSEIAYR